MPDKVSSCSKCGAPIIFCKLKWTPENPNPKWNPINRLPSENGNLLANFHNLTYEVVSKEDLGKFKEMANPPRLYLSHFVNCPKAKEFKKK